MDDVNSNPLSPCELMDQDLDDDETLLLLPDELIGCCLQNLEAEDLVRLELVSRRLRSVVSSDYSRWRELCMSRWKSNSPQVLELAAEFAGGWKRLYSEKHVSEKETAPWLVPCISEVSAIVELIKGEGPPTPTGSPVSILLDAMGTSHFTNVLSVVILVDGSSSVTEDDFSAMRQFGKTLMGSLRSTYPGSHAALVQFNQYPRVESPLSPIASGESIAALDKMEQIMGSTDIAAPIRLARELLTSSNAPGGDKVILLLTDGQTHNEELAMTEREARGAAEECGARVFTFGVGRDVDEAGLERVAAGSRRFVEGKRKNFGGCYFTLRRLKK